MKTALLLSAITLVACATHQRPPEPIAPRAEAPPIEERPKAPALPWAYAANAEAVPVDGPAIALVGSTIEVDGAVVAKTDGVMTAGPIPRLDDLEIALRTKRETWKQAHGPSDAFPGRVVIRLPATTAMRVVRLVVNSAALAGYAYAFHVVRTGDGSREGAVELAAAVPAMGKAPARLLVYPTAKEIALLWRESTSPTLWETSHPRALLQPATPSSPVPAGLVGALRDAWTKGPADAREWVLSTRDCEAYENVIALADAIAIVRGNTVMSVTLNVMPAPGPCG